MERNSYSNGCDRGCCRSHIFSFRRQGNLDKKRVRCRFSEAQIAERQRKHNSGLPDISRVSQRPGAVKGRVVCAPLTARTAVELLGAGKPRPGHRAVQGEARVDTLQRASAATMADKGREFRAPCGLEPPFKGAEGE